MSRAIARLIDAYQDGLLNKEEFEPRLAGQRERQTHLRQQQQAMAATAQQHDELRLVIAHLGEFQERIKAGLESLDGDDFAASPTTPLRGYDV